MTTPSSRRWRRWKPRCACSLISLLAICAPATSLDQGRERPTYLEVLDVNLVNVEVIATDKKGRPVSGLTANDFEVFEDDKRMKLIHFEALGEGESPQMPSSSAVAGKLERAGSAATVAGHLVLVVDNFALRPDNRQEILNGLREVLDQVLESDSAILVASYDGFLRIEQTFTRDRDLLLAAIEAVAEPNPLAIARQADRAALMRSGLRTLQTLRSMVGSDTRGTEVSRYLRNFAREIDAHAHQLRQQTAATYFALSHLVNALGALPGRKEMVYVSEGLPLRAAEEMYYAVGEMTRQEMPDLSADNSQEARDASLDIQSAALGALSDSAGRRRRSGRGTSPPDDLQALIALANSSRVSFYTLRAPSDIGGMPPELGGEAAALYTPRLRSIRENNLAETLRLLARETGGLSKFGFDIGGLLHGMESDRASYYSLAYSPAHSGDGQFHRIKVRSRRRGVRVRHRTSYLDKPVEVRLADRTSAALLLERDDNPLGIALAPLPARGGSSQGSWIVPLSVTIPLDQISLVEQGGVFAADLQLFVASRDATGNVAPVQGMAVHIEATELERTSGRSYTAQLGIELREGPQRVAIGLVDPLTGTASFVGRDLVVGAD